MAKTSTEFGLGDLMWAKIGSYPYWPCIISTSPGTQSFQKQVKKGSLVHVHFFGDSGKHSWVSSSSLMLFKGTDEFNKLKFKPGDTTKPQPGFLVKSNLKPAWDAAVKEIESVEKLNGEQRLDTYYKLYPLRSITKGGKRKEELSEEEVPAKVSKSAPPKKAVEHNGDSLKEEVEEKKPSVEEPKTKKTKSAPPKKAIKAAVLESLVNGETTEPEPVKGKKEPKNKKPEASSAPVETRPDPEPVKPEETMIDLDLKPVMRRIQDSLQAIISDKKQMSLGKSLIEKIIKLAVNAELTDKMEIK